VKHAKRLLVAFFARSATASALYELLHQPYEDYRKAFADWYRSHSGGPLQTALAEVL